MMPPRKHAAHREANEQGAANADPPSQAEGATDAATQPRAEGATNTAASAQAEGATNTAASAQAGGGIDDLQVPWRKERPAGSTTAEAAAEPATTATEEAVDWEARFKAEQAKADDYFAKWQRGAADLANMRRRHEQERQEYMKQANAMLIAELLPVL